MKMDFKSGFVERDLLGRLRDNEVLYGLRFIMLWNTITGVL